MKKLLLILSVLICMPVFGLCNIGDSESICSIQNNNSSSTLFQKQESGMDMNKQLLPSELNNSFQQTQNKNGIDINSSLGCQFGNCNQGLNNSFLKNQ